MQQQLNYLRILLIKELPRAEAADEPVANGPSQEPPVDGSASGTVPPSPAIAEDQLLQNVMGKLQEMGFTPQPEAQDWSQHSWQQWQESWDHWQPDQQDWSSWDQSGRTWKSGDRRQDDVRWD